MYQETNIQELQTIRFCSRSCMRIQIKQGYGDNGISQIKPLKHKTSMRRKHGSIFTFINDCFCDIRLVDGTINDKL